uniref:DNA-directed RNA polymerase n=1 Tax=Rhizophora mucronata TaxID=61149 RepID=A0A2P2MP82_RHIMU
MVVNMGHYHSFELWHLFNLFS